MSFNNSPLFLLNIPK